MRVVEQQPGVVALAQRQQFGHRRDIAVHAEHRVGDHQLAARRSWPRAGAPARPDRRCAIALELGARQQRRIVERGMVELVGKHRIAAPDQRGDDAEVGHVAGGKQQRARQAARIRASAVFERVMRRAVAEDQMRGAGADAVARGAFAAAAAPDRGSAGEAEIIVAAERDELAAVDRDMRAPAAFPAGGACGCSPRASSAASSARARKGIRAASGVRRRTALQALRRGSASRLTPRPLLPSDACRASSNSARSRFDFGVAGGQQLFAVENRIGAGEETQRLYAFAAFPGAPPTAAPSLSAW